MLRIVVGDPGLGEGERMDMAESLPRPRVGVSLRPEDSTNLSCAGEPNEPRDSAQQAATIRASTKAAMPA